MCSMIEGAATYSYFLERRRSHVVMQEWDDRGSLSDEWPSDHVISMIP
jgi:hypothetical protein